MRLLAHAVRSVWNLCDDEPEYRHIHLHHSRKRIRGGVGHERPTVGGSLAAIMSLRLLAKPILHGIRDTFPRARSQ